MDTLTTHSSFDSLTLIDESTSRSSTPEPVFDPQMDDSPIATKGMKDDTFPEKASSKRTFHQRWCFVLVILLDLPLFGVLLLTSSLVWLDHVHHHYLLPQMHNLDWNSQRGLVENTYYARQCDARDLSTNSSADLFVPEDMPPREAAAHQIKHGFTVIQNVISDETMTALRDLIHFKNYNEESMYVIEGNHRFSIMFGTEDKIVRDALQEIGNHKQFRETMEEMMGPDPAMIEMTAISSSAGAVAQWWHSDVDDTASSTNYARSFGPSYRVFIQLQNTTRAMGATAICPGSHYCTDGPISAFCEEAGLHGVNADGVSKGDALIMNMNSYHRGSAHVDYGGLDRVMLILTFSPKPSRRAETRQMSQGITFQLRWDMWGHTLNDLANANKVMVQPWVTLKSLGLYKLPGTSWGIDYITSSAQRIVSVDNGFRRYDLVSTIKNGGFNFIPSFLHGTFRNHESWYEFMSRTLKLCLEFMKVACVKVLGLYVVSALLLCIPFKPRLSYIRTASIRFLVVIGGVGFLFWFALSTVDNSGWGKDNAARRKFTSVAKHEKAAFDKSCMEKQQGKLMFCSPHPTTFPNQKDVLIETRMGTEKLANFNKWIDGHPGNIMFRNLIESTESEMYNDSSMIMKDAMARSITSAVIAQQGRFLYQKPDGTWVRLTAPEAEVYTKQEMWLQANVVASQTSTWIRYLQTEIRFGEHRDTVMAMDHSRRFMQDVEGKILKRMRSSLEHSTNSGPISLASKGRRVFQRTPLQFPSRVAPLRLSKAPLLPVEPYPGAWIEEGDLVEAMTVSDEEGGWYGGRVTRVNGLGSYTVEFGDETVETVTMHQIRRVQKLKVGDKIEVIDDAGGYQACEVLVAPDVDGNIVVKNLANGQVGKGISTLYISRIGGYKPFKPDRNSPVYGLVTGAVVEVLNSDEDVWYTGTITNVDNEGDAVYTIDFVDETSSTISDPRTIRPLTEYKPGEILKVFWEDDYHEVKFVSKLSYGTYKGENLETGGVVEGFKTVHVGRTGNFSK